MTGGDRGRGSWRTGAVGAVVKPIRRRRKAHPPPPNLDHLRDATLDLIETATALIEADMTSNLAASSALAGLPPEVMSEAMVDAVRRKLRDDVAMLGAP